MKMNGSQTSSGRPLASRTIRAKAAQHARDAVAVLAEIARDTKAPTSDRVAAASALLTHATEQKAA